MIDPLSIAVACTAIGFIAYHFIAESRKIQASDSEEIGIQKIFFKRWTGVVCLGVLPAIVTLTFTEYSLIDLGLGFQNFGTSVIWILGLSSVAVLVNSINSIKQDNLAMYPEVRAKNWSKALVFNSAFTWTAYLFAYEFLFRGILWFCTAPVIGFIPAIVLNCAFYALVHVPKGKKETIGAIPLGIILCILTDLTGTFWIAFVVHIALALSNEWFSLKHHPEMKIIK
jgi:membrane protease YdiL (CAAX protease family)